MQAFALHYIFKPKDQATASQFKSPIELKLTSDMTATATATVVAADTETRAHTV